MEKAFGVSSLKTYGEAGSGKFEALVSVFGNVDAVKDRVLPGAFARAIKESPAPPPVVWSHYWNIPPIGSTLDWAEQPKGLWAKGELFVGADDNHMYADMTYAAMKERDGRMPALREFSFSYDIPDGGAESKSEDSDGNTIIVQELKELFPIYEIGPCLRGCNPATEMLAAPKQFKAEGLARLERLSVKLGLPMDALLAKIEETLDPEPGDELPTTRYSPEIAELLLAVP